MVTRLCTLGWRNAQRHGAETRLVAPLNLILWLVALVLKALLILLLSLRSEWTQISRQLVLGKRSPWMAIQSGLLGVIWVVLLEQVLHLLLVPLQVVGLALIELLLQSLALCLVAFRVQRVGAQVTSPVVGDLVLRSEAHV